MCVLYLLKHGSHARKEGGRIVVETECGDRHRLPIQGIDCVIAGKHAQLTTETVYALMDDGIRLVYVDWRGETQGVLEKGNESLARLQAQMRYFGNGAHQVELARDVLQKKLRAEEDLLRQYADKAPDFIRETIDAIKGLRHEIPRLNTIDKLRGQEGMAARLYFDVFPCLLDAGLWMWQGRARKPAYDPVNALLNYGYAFLEREVRLAILGAGLDARIGFLHTNNGRKDSLVYDLMEPFRSDIIDRFTFRLLNYRKVCPEGFGWNDERGCHLLTETRNLWISEYEQFMQKPRQRYDGMDAREWLRAYVRGFARDVLKAARAELVHP